MDIMSPNVDYNRHISDDVVPYVTCCQAVNARCNKYYQWRPSGNETQYALPVPGKHYIHRHTVTVQLLQNLQNQCMHIEYMHAHS